MALIDNDLKIVKKNIKDLIPAEYNPRKINQQEREQIKASLQRYGFVDPVIVNVHPDRKNIIVGGHQRVTIGKELGYKKVPCVEVNLTPDREKELNVRLNKNTGSWDDTKFVSNFTKELLQEIGFKDSELKMYLTEFEEKFNQYDNNNVPYPIVPKFSEKYDCVIIISKNEIDTTFLETVLQIETSRSYKNSHTGKAMVIDVEKFKEAWEQLQ